MLVEQDLQAEAIHADGEATSPKVWPPVANGLHKADQLMLIGHQLEVVCSKRLAEEGERFVILVEYGAKPCIGGVIIDDERLVKDWHLEDGAGGQGALQCLERYIGLVRPGEGVLAQ